jgi:hypothetical protein
LNAHAPPKEKPLLGGKGLHKLTRAIAYQALDFIQAPLGFLFWLIEQRKARLQDRLDNEENDQ